MTTTVLPRAAVRLRRARLGVFGMFVAVGFLMGTWLANIPAVQERTGVDHAVLGGLILLLGAGSLVAMQVAGWFIDRVGSRLACLIGIIIMIAAVVLPGIATDAIGLGVALFIFGFGSGAADVSMNHQAVVVERRYGRPIMSTFHAFFSFGGAIGAILGAGAQAVGLGLLTTLLISATLAVAAAAFSVPALLSPAESVEPSSEAHDGSEQASPSAAASRSVRLRIVALGVLAFLFFLIEGAASDWSALHAVEQFDQGKASAALAYGTFAVAMTVGRLFADRISHAFGAVSVVRYGSIVGALGMLLVVLAPWYGFVLAGWALLGLGISGIVPQIFSAAGNLGGTHAAVTFSRIVGVGYVGFLAGPALIGFLGGAFGLTVAFILPLAFCLVGAVLASAVAKPRPRGVSDDAP